MLLLSLQVAYRVKYSPAGEILNVTLSLVIRFIHESELPLQQEFQITFFQVGTNRATPCISYRIWLCVDVFIQIHKFFFSKYSTKPLQILNFVQTVNAASQNPVCELNGSCESLTV